jgi:hypothetical protein
VEEAEEVVEVEVVLLVEVVGGTYWLLTSLLVDDLVDDVVDPY